MIYWDLLEIVIELEDYLYVREFLRLCRYIE